MKRCPNCKEHFGDADVFCPHHGLPLVPADGGDAPGGPALAPGDPALASGGPAQPDGEDRIYDGLIGTTIDGRYLVEERLGHGGMGVVFRARHTLIERSVAIKILKPQAASDPSIVARFLQEAKAASRIGNPHIVDVFDFGRLPDGNAYSVMELIPGDTLAQVLRRDGPLPIVRAVDIAAQLARALDQAHAKGIIHRDLKPENVFLLHLDGRPDFVKIGDFGIAKVATHQGERARLTRLGMVVGTPEYMAPEQAEALPDIDRRVDVYALGIILYEMLVGRVPHRGGSPVETMTMQVYDPIVPPCHAAPSAAISAALDRAVMRALAKDRDQRYPSMTELLTGLGTAIDQAVDRTVPLALASPAAAPHAVPETAHARSEAPHAGAAAAASAGPEAEPAASTTARPAADASAGPANGSAGPKAEPSAPATASPNAAAAPGSPAAASAGATAHASPAAATAGPADLAAAASASPGAEPAAPATAGPTGAATAGAAADRHQGSALSPAAARGSRSSMLVIPIAVLVAATAVTAGLLFGQPHGVGGGTAAGTDAGPVLSQADAGSAVAVLPLAPATVPPPDAAAVLAPDAAAALRADPDRTGSTAASDADPAAPAGRQLEIVVVQTDPPGGDLFLNGAAAGDDGAVFERIRGTRLRLACRALGHDPGNVTVVFDGRTRLATCRMKLHCEPGLKNPYGECPTQRQLESEE